MLKIWGKSFKLNIQIFLPFLRKQEWQAFCSNRVKKLDHRV
ncbi:Uncharacterized protein dnm_056480 [Desulfonema magnum]|uniref:Uncharacterized protein n=1 Tax=Desulfonema magnum TaxID=45655 RepID=A0A975GQ76_9BACT|nr:Uncharacterized protein dnm_056480 [Desulfonema magnum]